jgi:hypothetical protein
MRLARCAGIAAIVLAAIPAYAQSLGELARQEEVRRGATTKAAKTLSNSDLRPQDITSPSSAAPAVESSCFMSISKGRCVTAEELLALSNDKVVSTTNAPFEQGWRQDAKSLRTRIEGEQKTVATFEAIAADESKSPGDRKSAERQLAAARQALAGYERQWEKFETSAAAMKIPHAWIEPTPTLSKYQTPQ